MVTLTIGLAGLMVAGFAAYAQFSPTSMAAPSPETARMLDRGGQ